ncbi:polysaccharide lyase family 1 protein [Bacteroides sp. 214]|uniref:pectate lyase family protein n=1 Tax=Bacteroides sp. 214 TaxID=2302935 RepID=UPI0019403387|nr:pectate lyase [Bacteroides sp. 214]
MRTLLTISFYFSFAIAAVAQTPAFPGAEGGGMYTTGGRGGTVYYVNTLEDTSTGNSSTKEGSLRWCLNQTGVRTILFKVSGTIMLNSKLSIKNGNVTIAGQTAPGDGICLANHPVEISANNVIIRYLRIRMGDDSVISGGADALGGRFFKNVIVDHCSMSWSTDECVSFYNCNYFTLQWCLISESLRLSTHDKGPHGYGGIWGGTDASFHHNFMVHHDSRVPRFGPGANIKPHTETVDHRNNVLYNYGNIYGGEAMNINMVNNYYKPGARSSTGTARGRIMSIDKDKNTGSIRYNIWGQFYIDGNVVDDGKNEVNCNNATRDNWTYGVFNQFPSGYGTVSEAEKAGIKMSEPFVIKGLSGDNVVPTTVTTHTAEKAYEKVLEFAGASLRRDSHDLRMVEETQAGTTNFIGLSIYNGYGTNYPGMPDVNWKSTGYPKAGIIDSHRDIKPANADANWTPWPTLVQETAPTDTNRDGIPDGWLESNYPGKTATDLNEEGYTYLEVYINSLVNHITVNQNSNTSSGLKENSAEKNITMFYNRTSKEVHISANNGNTIKKVVFYDIAGRMIATKEYSKETSVVTQLPNSTNKFFFVRILLENNETITYKLFV